MRGKNLKYRLLIGVVIALFFVVKRCSQREVNPYTGRTQTISMTPDKEIAIGLQSAPQMAQQHGGLHSNNQYQAFVDQSLLSPAKDCAARGEGRKDLGIYERERHPYEARRRKHVERALFGDEAHVPKRQGTFGAEAGIESSAGGAVRTSPDGTDIGQQCSSRSDAVGDPRRRR